MAQQTGWRQRLVRASVVIGAAMAWRHGCRSLYFMILAFADDRSVVAVDDIAQANTECEAIDVENGVFIFIDEHAAVLRPTFTKPTRRTLFGRLASPDNFSLVVTQEQRPDLLQAILDGKVSVESGPRIHTREELIRELTKCQS